MVACIRLLDFETNQQKNKQKHLQGRISFYIFKIDITLVLKQDLHNFNITSTKQKRKFLGKQKEFLKWSLTRDKTIN